MLRLNDTYDLEEIGACDSRVAARQLVRSLCASANGTEARLPRTTVLVVGCAPAHDPHRPLARCLWCGTHCLAVCMPVDAALRAPHIRCQDTFRCEQDTAADGLDPDDVVEYSGKDAQFVRRTALPPTRLPRNLAALPSRSIAWQLL